MSPHRRLLYSLVALGAVFTVGTLGYMLIEEEPSPTGFQAAYQPALPRSTGGFKETWEISPAGKVWTLLIITFGIGTVSMALTSLTSVFVSGDLRYSRGRKRVEAKIKELKDHVILCGYGRMGQLAGTQLGGRGVPVVVVEQNKETGPRLLSDKVLFVLGDATDEETLLRAGLMKARTLVALLPHDADNVFITLTAHTLRPDLEIIARGEQPATERKLLRAGATRAICPQIMGATRITNLITRPFVVDFVEIANKGVDLELDEYVIGDESVLCDVSLVDSLLRQKTGAMVVAIKRADGETLFNPQPQITLRARDTLIIVGQAGVSERLAQIEA